MNMRTVTVPLASKHPANKLIINVLMNRVLTLKTNLNKDLRFFFRPLDDTLLLSLLHVIHTEHTAHDINTEH